MIVPTRLKRKVAMTQEVARGQKFGLWLQMSRIPVSVGDQRCSWLYLSLVLSPC